MSALTTLGDMSRGFRVQNQVTSLKKQLEQSGYEVTTGQSSDLSRKLRGDFSQLGAIEAALNRLDIHQNSLAESRSFVEAGQRALETIQDRAMTSGANLITASSSADSTVAGAIARDTRQALNAVVSALNTQNAGRTIFAGMNTGSAAIASGDAIMAGVLADVSALTTADDIVAAVDAWFDDASGGFETSGYLGSTQSLGAFDLGLGQSTSFDFAADDSEIRDVLKGFVLGALLDEFPLPLPASERQSLVRQSGERLLTAEKQLAQYRADVGTTEAAIETASVRNASEASGLQLARAGIVGVDQYAAANTLEATQVQLEMLYTITVRMSRLNLMEFLR